jgi:mannose-6-phosphate isomerase-like protein (cupin superfamily)|tara:strand:- start:656 stop:1126 length:471 start_codon:yes stop_codon:yes gene_type:complete
MVRKMRKILIVTFTISSFMVAVMAQEAVPPALYYDSEKIGTDLAASLSQRPNFGVGRINLGEDYNINMIRRGVPAGAIVHPEGTEIHFIVEGAGELTTGGIAVRPEAGGPANIEGGYAQRVTVGDLVLIPAGTPHQYTAVEGVVGYLEVRFKTSEY